MAITHIHQGSRLKKIVEKSHFTVDELATKAGIHRTTLYNYYDREEIPRAKLTTLAEIMGVKIDDFYSKDNMSEVEVQNEQLKKEIDYLKQQLVDKEEIIKLLKAKK